jgi:xanthine dehydrogenase iron-sulfur cluster and FAD-binding subunit A
MLMTASALLRVSPGVSRDEVAAAIAGNLCRCTGYVKIIDAIEAARDAASAGRSEAPSRARPEPPIDPIVDTAESRRGA